MTNDVRSSFLIYLIGEETLELAALRVSLTQAGFHIINFRKVEAAFEKVAKNPPHVTVVDLEGQNLNAEQYLEKFANLSPETLHIATIGKGRDLHAPILMEMGFYETIERSQTDGRVLIGILDRAIERIYYQYQAEQVGETSEKKISELEQVISDKDKTIAALNEKLTSQTKQAEDLFQKIRNFQIRISQLESELEASESKTQRYIADYVKIKNDKDSLETQVKRYKGDAGTSSLGFTGLMSSLGKCHSVEDAVQDWLNKTHRLYQDVPVAFFRYIPNHSHLVLAQCAGLEIQKVRGIGIPLAGLSLKEQKYFYSHVRFLANLRDLLKGAFNVSEFEFRELVTDRGVVGICVIFRSLKTDVEKRFFNDSIELLNLVANRNSLAFKVHEYDLRDDLTQLYTRRSLDESLTAEMSRAGRTRLPLSALYIRIDDFAELEKKWESETEKVIKAVATILRKTSRINDLLYRIEKDQFVALLPHTDCQGAKVKAETLRNFIKKAQIRTTQGQIIPNVSISVGISEYPKLCRDSEGLLISSDEALFEAAKSGDCVQLATSIEAL